MLWLHGIKWDGKGFEAVTKTMNSNNSHSCNVCNFPGVYFAGTERYPFYSRYTPKDDARRSARPPVGVAHIPKSIFFFLAEPNP